MPIGPVHTYTGWVRCGHLFHFRASSERLRVVLVVGVVACRLVMAEHRGIDIPGGGTSVYNATVDLDLQPRKDRIGF
jgi:hypothetical protein